MNTKYFYLDSIPVNYTSKKSGKPVSGFRIIFLSFSLGSDGSHFWSVVPVWSTSDLRDELMTPYELYFDNRGRPLRMSPAKS